MNTTIAKQTYRVLWRTKSICISMVLLLVGEVAICIWALQGYTITNGFEFALQKTYSAVPFALAMFIYMGYELTVRFQEGHLWEKLAAGRYLDRAVGAVWLVLGTLVIGNLLLILVFNTVFYAVGGLWYGAFFKNLLLSHLLYYGLTPLIGATVGIALALYLKRKRILVYLITIVFVLLNTGYVETMLKIPMGYGSQAGTDALYAVKDFFTLSPLSIKENYNMETLYGMPNEGVRWLLGLVWLSSMAGCILYKILRPNWRRTVCLAATGAVLLTAAWGYVPPGSRLLLDNRPSGYAGGDQFYYTGVGSNLNVPADVGYAIEGYEMDLTIRKTLRASVTMRIDLRQPDTQELLFTLSHHYRVKAVQDANGKPADFRQQGDSVVVPVTAIQNSAPILTMIYEGYSPKFFANDQAIALPGYFPYYPWEGNKKVWNDELYGFDTTLPDGDKTFAVTVHTRQRVYSNLDGLNNALNGTAPAMSLYAGMMEEAEPGLYVTPGVNRDADILKRTDLLKVQTLIEDIEQKLDIDLDLPDMGVIPCFEKRDSFAMSQTDFVVLMGDHLITQFPWPKDIASEVLMTKLGGNMFNNNYLTQLLNYALGEETPSSESNMNQPAAQHLSQMERYVEMDDVDKLMNFAEIAMPATQYLLWVSPNAEANEQALWKALLAEEDGDPSETVTELLRLEVQGIR